MSIPDGVRYAHLIPHLTACCSWWQGKVRDVYEITPDSLLVVTTDRISANDVVMPNFIPGRGAILNQMTVFWMEKFKDLVPNHLIHADVEHFPADLSPYAHILRGRSVVAKKAKPLPIECIVRGYITGSGWKDYQQTGAVCGHALPAGLLESQMLPEAIFTPSTKADQGKHDENISVKAARDMIGFELSHEVEELSLIMYIWAQKYAQERGIIIADTKFEFGTTDDGLILIDEVLTPDSSRFWPAEGYVPGRSQPSFDKQYLRDWLTGIGFNKKPPAPHIPDEVVNATREKYLMAFKMLTGSMPVL